MAIAIGAGTDKDRSNEVDSSHGGAYDWEPFNMDHFVQIDEPLTSDFFPEELKSKIHFDDKRRCLVFSGFMTRYEFDRLRQLNGGLSYQRALHRLFQISTIDTEPVSHRFRNSIFAIASLCAVAGLVYFTIR